MTSIPTENSTAVRSKALHRFPGKLWKWLLLTAVLLSAVIEAVQYVFNLGWCEIDDVICNVLGAAIGFGLWKLIKGKMHAV